MNKTALAPVLAAGVIGGGVGAGGVVALGVGDDDSGSTKTVVQQAPISAGTEPASDDGAALTPRAIYKRDAPGVVSIRATIVRQVQSPFDLFGIPGEQQGQSSGSGFVVDKQGFILTNAHVIEGASRVTVQFEENKTTSARVVGKDVSTDIALLKVDPDGLELKPLALGDSAGVQVGDPAVAIGNPFGLDRTLTTGVVSAMQRRIDAPDNFTISDVIQTDAPINPGNSGGPLIDATGRVIGINSQIATGGTSQGSVGIGFAVPVNTVKRVMPQLKSTGSVERAFLGIKGATIDASLDRLNLAAKTGVLVQSVTRNSPADKAGLRGGDTAAQFDGGQLALGGDVITKLDGKDIDSMDDIVAAVDKKKPGQTLELEIIRDGKTRTLEIKLAKRPNEAAAQPR